MKIQIQTTSLNVQYPIPNNQFPMLLSTTKKLQGFLLKQNLKYSRFKVGRNEKNAGRGWREVTFRMR